MNISYILTKFVLGSSKAFARQRALAFEETVNAQINNLRDDLERQIDEALAGLQTALDGKCRIREGSYNGNGSTSLRTVATSGTPKVLLLSTGSSVFAVLDNGKTVNRVTVINNGFRIEAGSGDPNQSGKTYHFAAFL